MKQQKKKQFIEDVRCDLDCESFLMGRIEAEGEKSHSRRAIYFTFLFVPIVPAAALMAIKQSKRVSEDCS